jgi:hypothetical protein
MNPRGAIGLALLAMNHFNLYGQVAVLLFFKTFWTPEPGIITAAGDIKNITHPAYPENLPVIRYESIFHF